MIAEFDRANPNRNETRTTSPAVTPPALAAARNTSTWVGVSAPTPCSIPMPTAVFWGVVSERLVGGVVHVVMVVTGQSAFGGRFVTVVVNRGQSAVVMGVGNRIGRSRGKSGPDPDVPTPDRAQNNHPTALQRHRTPVTKGRPKRPGSSKTPALPQRKPQDQNLPQP